MKKRMILIILFIVELFLSIFLYSCAKDNDKLSKTISNEHEWIEGRMEEIINLDYNKSLSNLDTYSFSIVSHSVGGRFFPKEFKDYISSVGYNINYFNDIADLKVNYIYKIDNENIAAIYKVIEEGLDEVYAVVVFNRIIDASSNTESWEKTGELYFVNSIHKYSDFIQIKEGDSIEKLYLIDKSIYYDVLRKENSSIVQKEYVEGKLDYNYDPASSPKMIYKLLEDGYLLVEYDLESSKILNIFFYSIETDELPFGIYTNVLSVLKIFNNAE